jgi:hypothetical protein
VNPILATKRAVLLLVVAGLLLVASSARAQAQPYDLDWNTIDGGGYTFSIGGPYTLGGTIGQPDAGLLLGGGYGLAGGFWGMGWTPLRVYLPIVLRNAP